MLKGVIFFLSIISFFVFLSANKLYSTERYAERTGKDCIYCHKEPIGTGGFTKEGEDFLVKEKGFSFTKRLIRFVTLYFHLLFSIAWFGTILYVHIILKPGYASKGLPRGELMLGWCSIIVMAITGIILTTFKIQSFSELYSSRFGIILSLKILFFLIMFFTALFVTLYLGPKMRKKIKQKNETDLTYYNGKEGRPAYIQYNEKVYDVTESKLWKNGIHMNRHFAGEDLTEALKFAPHKEDVLERFKPVEFSLNRNSKKDVVIKTFYFLAYTNLIIVFIIIFLITLWRW